MRSAFDFEPRHVRLRRTGLAAVGVLAVAAAIGAAVIPSLIAQSAPETGPAPVAASMDTPRVAEIPCDQQAWPYVDAKCAPRTAAAAVPTRQVRVLSPERRTDTASIAAPESNAAPDRQASSLPPAMSAQLAGLPARAQTAPTEATPTQTAAADPAPASAEVPAAADVPFPRARPVAASREAAAAPDGRKARPQRVARPRDDSEDRRRFARGFDVGNDSGPEMAYERRPPRFFPFGPWGDND